MRKPVGLIVFLFMFIICLFSAGIRAKAYTDEEKAQAKAWLSAHGYSPDADGAAAAYQDYLNGKFDEELGITREDTEDSTEDSSSYSDENSVGDMTAKASEEQTLEEQPRQEQTSEEPSVNANTQESAHETDESTGNGTEHVEEKTPVSSDELEKDEVNPCDSSISIYQKEKMDDYKEAFVVIVLSVLVSALAMCVTILMKAG